MGLARNSLYLIPRDAIYPVAFQLVRRLGYIYVASIIHYAKGGPRDHYSITDYFGATDFPVGLIPAIRAGRGGYDGRSDSNGSILQGADRR